MIKPERKEDMFNTHLADIQYVVMTDLDGTLLNHHDYQWQAAQPALNTLSKLGVPVIINSSKTRLEVKKLAEDIGLSHFPYIIENGSALIIPPQYSTFIHHVKDHIHLTMLDGQAVWAFGESRNSLCKWLRQVRDEHKWQFEGYQDWNVDQVMAKTGLDEASALLSMKKEFSEPFIWMDSEENFKEFETLVKQAGLNLLKGGRFYHLQGNVNKASYFSFFRQYQTYFWPNKRNLSFICLGDNHNDVAMLKQADYPILIKSPVNDFPDVEHNKVIHSQAFGAQGWNDEVIQLMNRINL